MSLFSRSSSRSKSVCCCCVCFLRSQFIGFEFLMALIARLRIFSYSHIVTPMKLPAENWIEIWIWLDCTGDAMYNLQQLWRGLLSLAIQDWCKSVRQSHRRAMRSCWSFVLSVSLVDLIDFAEVWIDCKMIADCCQNSSQWNYYCEVCWNHYEIDLKFAEIDLKFQIEIIDDTHPTCRSPRVNRICLSAIVRSQALFKIKNCNFSDKIGNVLMIFNCSWFTDDWPIGPVLKFWIFVTVENLKVFKEECVMQSMQYDVMIGLNSIFEKLSYVMLIKTKLIRLSSDFNRTFDKLKIILWFSSILWDKKNKCSAAWNLSNWHPDTRCFDLFSKNRASIVCMINFHSK